MKKLFFALFALMFMFPALLFAGSIEYTKLDVAGWRGTHYLNGDFIMFQSTPSLVSNFEIKSGSITKCSSINSTNATITNATITTGTVTDLSVSSISISGVRGGEGGSAAPAVGITGGYSPAKVLSHENWVDCSTVTVPMAGKYLILSNWSYKNVTTVVYGIIGRLSWNDGSARTSESRGTASNAGAVSTNGDFSGTASWVIVVNAPCQITYQSFLTQGGGGSNQFWSTADQAGNTWIPRLIAIKIN